MRRAGYTNTLVAPITWSDSTVVGATHFNPYVRDNIFAIDNRITPLAQDVIHFTPTANVSVSNETVVMTARKSFVNLLALSEYSSKIALSVDLSVSFQNTTASVVWVDTIVVIDANAYRYRMYKTPEYYSPTSFKDPGIGATNYISGAHLGNTDYAFWSGFVVNDVLGNSPFSLTSEFLEANAAIVVGATGGSVDLVDPRWSVRFRANVAATVQNPSTNYDPGVGIYGQSAF